eukprot:tig00000808_g4411.t1
MSSGLMGKDIASVAEVLETAQNTIAGLGPDVYRPYTGTDGRAEAGDGGVRLPPVRANRSPPTTAGPGDLTGQPIPEMEEVEGQVEGAAGPRGARTPGTHVPAAIVQHWGPGVEQLLSSSWQSLPILRKSTQQLAPVAWAHPRNVLPPTKAAAMLDEQQAALLQLEPAPAEPPAPARRPARAPRAAGRRGWRG